MKEPKDMTEHELDVAVAVEVMGAKPSNLPDVYHIGTDCIVTGDCVPRMPHRRFRPASSMNDAWGVVEKMRERGWWADMHSPFTNESKSKWMCGFNPLGVTGWNGRPDHEALADSMPRAICEAAIGAVRSAVAGKEGE